LDLILLDGAIADVEASPAQLKKLHACIKKVTEDLDGMRFNTAISAMMVFVNEAMTWQAKPCAIMKTFLQLLAPSPRTWRKNLGAAACHFWASRTLIELRTLPEFDPACW